MRKLAVGAAAFSTGVIVSAYIYVPGTWYVISGIFLLCFLMCLFIRKNIGKVLRIFFLMLSLGLFFYSFNHSFSQKTASAYSEDKTFTATVVDFPEIYDDYTRIEIMLSGKGRKCRAMLYDYYDNISTLKPGDVITFSAGLRSALDGKASETHLSKGILLTGSLNSGITVTKKGSVWLHFSKYLSHAVITAIPSVFPEDCVPFLKALLIGSRRDLYSDIAVYPALLRAGFMHTVAISGMHISFIAGFCLSVFGNGKRASAFSLIIIWLFIFMSGNTPSAVRAGIMQTVLLFAPFVKKENDPLTSLSLALLIILMINPFSAKSTGLQLSFAAVLGIILFSTRINSAILSGFKSEKLLRILRYPVGIISSSMGVMAFTIPLSAAHFGYISILSIITNLLALWAVPVCFCGAYFCLAVYLMFPGTAVFFARMISVLCRYIFYVCSFVSGLPHAVIPYEGPVTLILFALIYLLFLLFRYSDYSRLKRVILPLLFSVFMIVSYFVYFRISSGSARATVSIMDAGQGECIAAFAGNRAIVIDCGTSDYYINPGEECADYFYIRGQKNVDAVFLTHLHSDHVSGVCHLMELIPVRTVFVPVNIDLTDKNYNSIRRTAIRTGTAVVLVDMDSSVEMGGLVINLYPSYIDNDSNESCMTVKLTAFEKSFLITGDGSYMNEMRIADKESIGDVDVLVAGHHGADGASCTYFLRAVEPEYSVISVGRDNKYGHPSRYAIGRMLAEGIRVLRTDFCGRVTFLID